MKKLKALVSLALCATILVTLAACGGVGGNVTYGRYVEEVITPPGMTGYAVNFYYDESGIMDIVTTEYDEEEEKSFYRRYRSEDNGESWKNLDMSWADKYITDYSWEDGEEPEVYVYIDRLQVLEDSSLIGTVSYYYPQTGGRETEFISANLNGEVTAVDIPLLANLNDMGDEVYLNNMFMLDDTRMVLEVEIYMVESRGRDSMSMSDNGSIRGVFDIQTGEQLVDLSVYDGWNSFFSNGILYMEDESGFSAYSLDTGERLDIKLPESEKVWRANIYPGGSSSTVGADHTFYGITNKGLMKLDAEMEEAELIMDSLNYSYGSPACWVNNLYINGDEILMSAEDSIDGSLLLRYTWDAKAPATSDKHLTVYSLYENNGVRLALSQFKKQNPEVTLSYESALNRDDMYFYDDSNSEGAMTAEDALRALNTELLAGNGPDVLILDDLPLHSYIEKGILEDLSDVVEGIDVFHSAIDPLRTDKGLFAVPSHFSIPVFFGQAGKVEALSDFDTLLQEVQNSPKGLGAWPEWDSLTEEEWEEYYAERERPLRYDERAAMQFDSLDELITMMYETSAPAMYTEATGLNKTALRKYLESVKTISDHYGLAEGEYISNSVADSYMISMGGSVNSYSSSADYFARHRAKVGYAQLTTPYTIVNLAWSERNSRYEGYWDEETDEWVENEREDYEAQTTDMAFAAGLATEVYFPQNMAGVCTTSKEKELAKEFIATMVGYDVAKYNWYTNGLSINVEAFDSMWEEAFTVNRWQEEEGLVITEIPVKPLIEQLTTPYYTNEYLLHAIYENAVPYCQGNVSLDATIDTIVKQTEIYFAERQ